MKEVSDMELVRNARAFAAKAHAGVYRKYTGEPYIEHPARVAGMLAKLGLPPEVVAAAYLHDVVEDADVTIGEIEAAFGPKVAALVAEVTDPVIAKVPGNRPIRFAAYVAHVARTSPHGASIKLADMIDNSRNIVAVAPPSFTKRFMTEMAKKLAVLGHGHPELVAKARSRLPSEFRDFEVPDSPADDFGWTFYH
jgi:(p)ppGpp synthase/HD superfamily hydrolase